MVMITLPGLALFFNYDLEIDPIEKRLLFPFPFDELTFKKLPVKEIELFINDHFGFRHLLVTLDAIWRVYCLGMNPRPEVIQGKEGWLFYNEEHSLELYQGRYNVSYENIIKLASIMKNIQDEALSKNSSFLFVLFPNKITLYPQFLPNDLTISAAPNSSPIDLFFRELDNLDVFYLNMKEVYDDEASEFQVYFKEDTHCNNEGAWIAYEKIINLLGDEPYSCNEAMITSSRHYGDLSRLLGLINFSELDQKYEFVGDRNKNLKKLYVYGDSFFGRLRPWFHSQYRKESINERHIKSLFEDLAGNSIQIEENSSSLILCVERHLCLLLDEVDKIQYQRSERY